MKIILSRKGFDGSNGGCASPIMPDGTMLSMPIPSTDNDKYSDLEYNGISYSELLSQLNPKGKYDTCHLDPDLREDIRKNKVDAWQPAFRQISSANTHLRDIGVKEGDLFLFFGWYHRVVNENDKYRYTKSRDINKPECRNFTFYDYSDLHAVWGYMQIGEIITGDNIKKYYWHPHSFDERLVDSSNAIYIPAKNLSFNPDMPGCGTLKYRKDRVLTMDGATMGNWNLLDFMAPDNIYDNRHNSSKCGGLYYQGIWQELVLKESSEAEEWAKKIIQD